MDNNLRCRNYTRQSYRLINAKMSLSRLEIDIILALMTAIDVNDKDFKDYKFTIKDLENKLGHKLQSKQLKKSIKSLMSKPIELKNDEIGEWEIVNWFSYFKYGSNGVLSCRFDKFLKPFLLELKKRFVVSDLRMLLPMKSSYSKRMYLFLKEYSKIGKRTFDVEQLQEILNAPKGMRRYDNFKRQVLKRAEIDINKFTDLEVKLSEKKLGRKVVEVTYTIKKNIMDLKAFIQMIRELYPNELIHYTKDNRPLKCSTHGLLYYADDIDEYIDKKEAQKLWEYLHENRDELYIFKRNREELKKYAFLSSMVFFQEYIKENFVHKIIAKIKERDKILDISIFPNGRLYDMNGEYLSSDDIDELWNILYDLAEKDKLRVFKEE